MKRFDVMIDDNGELAVSVNDLDPCSNDYQRLVRAIAAVAREEMGKRRVRIDISMIIDGRND